MEEKRKILVVDDEEAFCKSLSGFFIKRGYDALYATSPDEAIDALRRERPDLMTLDIRMPGKSTMQAANGLEVLVKSRGILPSLRVIMISATDLVEDAESFKLMGAHAVHHKPVELDKLLGMVRELLGE